LTYVSSNSELESLKYSNDCIIVKDGNDVYIRDRATYGPGGWKTDSFKYIINKCVDHVKSTNEYNKKTSIAFLLENAHIKKDYFFDDNYGNIILVDNCILHNKKYTIKNWESPVINKDYNSDPIWLYKKRIEIDDNEIPVNISHTNSSYTEEEKSSDLIKLKGLDGIGDFGDTYYTLNENLEEDDENLEEDDEKLVEDYGKLEKDDENLEEDDEKLEKDDKKLVEDYEKLEKDDEKLVEDYGKLEEENKKLVEDYGKLEEENKNLVEKTKKLEEENKNLVEENKIFNKKQIDILNEIILNMHHSSIESVELKRALNHLSSNFDKKKFNKLTTFVYEYKKCDDKFDELVYTCRTNLNNITDLIDTCKLHPNNDEDITVGAENMVAECTSELEECLGKSDISIIYMTKELKKINTKILELLNHIQKIVKDNTTNIHELRDEVYKLIGGESEYNLPHRLDYVEKLESDNVKLKDKLLLYIKELSSILGIDGDILYKKIDEYTDTRDELNLIKSILMRKEEERERCEDNFKRISELNKKLELSNNENKEKFNTEINDISDRLRHELSMGRNLTNEECDNRLSQLKKDLSDKSSEIVKNLEPSYRGKIAEAVRRLNPIKTKYVDLEDEIFGIVELLTSTSKK
jgi:hypothetical protein